MRIILTAFALLLTSSLIGQTELAMTYNIRYDNPDDPLKWDIRKAPIASLMSKCGIIGVQEALQHQVYDLASKLTDYNWVGVGRDDGKSAGEYCPIFYNSEFQLITWETVWLSETPQDTASVGWDAALTRIATVAEFVWKDERLLVINAHFDHMGEESRTQSASLILQEIQSRSVDNVLLMGDFNALPKSACIRTFTEGGMTDHGAEAGSATYVGFDDSAAKRIDYVFSTGLQAGKTSIPKLKILEMNLSDHLPVIAEFE